MPLQMKGSARFSTVLLVLSLLANVALAWMARYPLSRPSPVAVPQERAPAVQWASVTNLSLSTRYVTNAFQWQMLKSTNLLEYMSNLRRVGCPEQTTADIILAEVDDLYSKWQTEVDQQPFWAAGRQRMTWDRKAREQHLALRRELEGFVQSLGLTEISWRVGFRGKDFEEQAIVRFFLGPMPEAKFLQVVGLVSSLEDREQEIQRRFGGLLTEQDEKEIEAVTETLRTRLPLLLSPLEYEEMGARLSMMALLDNSLLLEAVQLNPSELRQIAVLKSAGRPLIGSSGLFDDDDDDDDPVRMAQFTNGVAQLLGPARFADFVRAQDSSYKSIHEFAKDGAIPKVTAVRLYEIRKAGEDEARQAREDRGLDEASRRQRLREIQESIQENTLDLLGGNAFDLYLQQGGTWMTNASHL